MNESLDYMKKKIRERKEFECQECGKMVYPDEFHDFQYCREYKSKKVKR